MFPNSNETMKAPSPPKSHLHIAAPNGNKRRFIKDPVWGTIEILPWEVDLLNHFLVNRLHNIVQNSAAFKVYPGMRHSRFLHSVGVLHVVTEIFVNTIANSSDEAIGALDFELNRLQTQLPDSSVAIAEIGVTVSERFRCPKHYGFLLASLRFAAVLHDVGHLPYSHVFEHALESFVWSKDDGALEIDSEAAKLCEELRDLHTLTLTEDTQEESHDAPVKKTHEALGAAFCALLSEESDFSKKHAGQLVQSAVAILHTDRFSILKGFLVGNIDADRIDYIKRDCFFSGLLRSSVDYERLFAFYELVESDNGNFVPMPGPRAVSETEKLLWERFQDYEYVMAHHKVHLFDIVVEQILTLLMISGELNRTLAALVELLRLPKSSGLDGKRRLIKLEELILFDLDDTWLEGEFRRVHKKMLKERSSSNSLLGILTRSFYEERDFFHTVFKEDKDFWAWALEIGKEKELRAKRMHLAAEIGKNRFAIQEKIKARFSVTCLVDNASKKVKHGIGGEKAARATGLETLRRFLEAKCDNVRPFNIWIERQRSKSKVEIERLGREIALFTLKLVADNDKR